MSNRFNHYFNTHFSSCVLLAHAHDPYRQRDVQLRLLPGEFDVVGVTDGTDAWVAPVVGDSFRVNIKRILDDIRAGKPHVAEPMKRRERKQLMAPPPEPPASEPSGGAPRVRRQLTRPA